MASRVTTLPATIVHLRLANQAMPAMTRITTGQGAFNISRSDSMRK